MKDIIGFNLICFAISSLIIFLLYDGSIKEKIIGIIFSILFIGTLSVGVFMITC